MINKKGFTLIELLVVVLIIAILATIALPKYMITRDRAHLSGLMTIGKNVNDALGRRSLFDNQEDSTALDLLDITFQKSDGSGDCTTDTCRIKVSGKEYKLRPLLNAGGLGKNHTAIYSYDNTAIGMLDVLTNEFNSSYKYILYCYSMGYISSADLEEARCEKLANSMGASCAGGEGARVCYFQ